LRIKRLFKQAGLPIDRPKSLKSESFLQLMAVDKKNVDGDIRLILLKKIGEATLPVAVEESELIKVLNN